MGQPSRKIALLIHAMNGGGAERMMAELCQYLAPKHELSLITWADRSTDSYALPPSVNRISLKLQSPSRNVLHGIWANIRRVSKLRSALRELSPEMVISFTDQMNIVALQAARPLSAPVVICEHSNPARQHLGGLWEAWRSSVYARCSACVALTTRIGNELKRWVPEDKICIIPNALHASASRSESVPISARRNTILYVGRLAREKRVDRLLSAWKSLEPQLPDWRVVIAGDGPLASELKASVADDARVEFLGWVSDPRPLFAEAGMFVLPSEYEAFPISILEAMLHGTPCVATECSDLFEEWNQQQECVLLASEDNQAMDVAIGERIKSLASSLELRQRLGEAGATKAAEYTWEIIGRQWDELIDRVGDRSS